MPAKMAGAIDSLREFAAADRGRIEDGGQRAVGLLLCAEQMIIALKKFFGLTTDTGAGGKTFHPARTCPECGSKLCGAGRGELPESQIKPHPSVKDGDSDNSSFPDENAEWLCPNPDCPAQVRRGLGHWCAPAAMDVAGGDEKLIALLVQHGLARDVAELYRIKVAELAALPGMDQESARKFFDALTASLKREGWRLLFGLNIPLVGAAEALALGRGFPTVDAVFAAGVPRLMQDAGVSEAVAQSVVRWHSDAVNRKLVRRLQKAGLNFRSELPAA